MSITDGDGKEVVQVSAIWSWAFKLLLAMTPVIGTVGLAWSIWVTTSIYGHSENLAVIKSQLSARQATISVPSEDFKVARKKEETKCDPEQEESP